MTNPRKLVLLVAAALPLWVGPDRFSVGADVNEGDKPFVAVHRDFARILGLHVEDRPVSIFPPMAHSSYFGTTVATVREVRSDALIARVDVETMKVVHAIDLTVTEQSWTGPKEHPSAPMTIVPTRNATDVIAIADQYCKRLGHDLSRGFRLRLVQFEARYRHWSLAWLRVVGEYPFEESDFSLSIDDKTGKLAVYFNNTSSRPCQTEIKVGREKAMDVARDHVLTMAQPALVRSEPLRMTEVGTCELKVVYPNYLLSPKVAQMGDEDLRKARRNPRLVYDIKYEFRYRRAEGKGDLSPRPPVSIWVDAATGEVVGGFF
ncbi:MAG: hypothetical protein FJ279_21150 [Planctomycetes bacterium]|nr:hypothetical protein [Planctomycetota bacterium]